MRCNRRVGTDLGIGFLCFQSGVEMELVESQPLLEWLANNYKSFGATLEIITDKSQEGSQFVRGFGGIGGKFRSYWSVAFAKQNNLVEC